MDYNQSQAQQLTACVTEHEPVTPHRLSVNFKQTLLRYNTFKHAKFATHYIQFKVTAKDEFGGNDFIYMSDLLPTEKNENIQEQ